MLKRLVARKRQQGKRKDSLGQSQHQSQPERWGQIIEGLESRRASWEITARYFEGEAVEQVIEECRDAEEARALVATYDRLIGELCSQLRA